MAVTKHFCEICGLPYDDLIDALNCEKKITLRLRHSVGDTIVTTDPSTGDLLELVLLYSKITPVRVKDLNDEIHHIEFGMTNSVINPNSYRVISVNPLNDSVYSVSPELNNPAEGICMN